MDVHEHCHRLLNYDTERNVVFCSKCKTEWGEPVKVVVEVMDTPAASAMPDPVAPKRRRK